MCVDSNTSSPTVIHVIPGDNHVGGVTSLGEVVFAVRYNSQQKIEVYDAKTFTLQCHITVPGLGDYSYGLAACPRNNCLYASDWSNQSVHRVELSGSGVDKGPQAPPMARHILKIHITDFLVSHSPSFPKSKDISIHDV